MAQPRARISGKILVTEKKQFGSGERVFKFTEARIQTGPASIESVRITDSWNNDFPRAGDVVDYEVEISGFSGRNGLDLTLTAVDHFNEAFFLDVATAANAA